MEPIQVLKIFIKCEKDLAKFYGQLKNISQLQEFVKVFEVMETHSYEHSEKIVDDFQRFHIPDLNIESLIVLHNNIKKNLFDELAHETNVLFVLKKLAEIFSADMIKPNLSRDRDGKPRVSTRRPGCLYYKAGSSEIRWLGFLFQPSGLGRASRVTKSFGCTKATQ